jgi:predicted nucleotidyltransferase
MWSIGVCRENPVTAQLNLRTYRDLAARQQCLPESVIGPLEFLTCVPEVTSVILFGSRAVGDHEDRSDIDIAISAPTLSRKELGAIARCSGTIANAVQDFGFCTGAYAS